MNKRVWLTVIFIYLLLGSIYLLTWPYLFFLLKGWLFLFYFLFLPLHFLPGTFIALLISRIFIGAIQFTQVSYGIKISPIFYGIISLIFYGIISFILNFLFIYLIINKFTKFIKNKETAKLIGWIIGIIILGVALLIISVLAAYPG